MASTGRRGPKPVVGWREYVVLTDLCPTPIKAKLDTGARTSALHAFDLEVTEADDGLATARFEIHPVQDSDDSAVTVELPVAEFREIRSSDGRVEERPIVRTTVRLGQDLWEIDVSLTNRDQMGFRMLVGRSALKRRYVVDPGRSYRRSAADTPDSIDPDDVPDLEQT